jgi:hypothetical protein
MKLFRVLVLVVALVAGGIAAFLALNMSPGRRTLADRLSNSPRRSSRRTSWWPPLTSRRARS